MLPSSFPSVVTVLTAVLTVVLLIVGRAFYGIDKRTKAQLKEADVRITRDNARADISDAAADDYRKRWISAQEDHAVTRGKMFSLEGENTALREENTRLKAEIERLKKGKPDG